MALKKFYAGSYKLLIYCHDEAFGDLLKLLEELGIEAKAIPIHYDINGYLKQMVVKCMCWQDVDTEYVAIMDSDVILKDFVKFEDFFIDGKLTWYYLPKTEQNSSETLWGVWGDSVFRMTKEPMRIFYMYNAFPFVFKKKTLREAHSKFLALHNCDYNYFCGKGLRELKVSPKDPISGPSGKFPEMSKIFEEFEYLGWYCHNHSDDYKFIEGPNPSSLRTRNQYWSHGGISGFEKEIIDILNKT